VHVVTFISLVAADVLLMQIETLIFSRCMF
jgi:hypothetical protein